MTFSSTNIQWETTVQNLNLSEIGCDASDIGIELAHNLFKNMQKLIHAILLSIDFIKWLVRRSRKIQTAPKLFLSDGKNNNSITNKNKHKTPI